VCEGAHVVKRSNLIDAHLVAVTNGCDAKSALALGFGGKISDQLPIAGLEDV
jgi:hypothetical protein